MLALHRAIPSLSYASTCAPQADACRGHQSQPPRTAIIAAAFRPVFAKSEISAPYKTDAHRAWQAAGLGAGRSAGFTSMRVLVPHAMPLRSLTKVFRGTSLLLTAHGSGMINQVHKPVGT